MDVAGKVVVITGAGSGIGAATAKMMADLGATVVVCDINEQAGSKVAEGVGGKGTFVKLDVTKQAEWEKAVEQIAKDHGGIDILHLNAGVLTRGGDAPDPHDYVLPWLDEKNLRKVMSINVDGVVFGTVAAIPHLQAREGSQIVITSSPAGLGGWAADPYYAMSKAAVNSWVQAMAQVLSEQKIRVNGVMPGTPVETDMMRPQWKTHPDLANATLSSPETMAKAIVELMQKDEGNGTVYLITGESQLVPVIPRPA